MRRVNSVSAATRPRVAMPKRARSAASKRRRSKQWATWQSVSGLLWRFITSARWISLGLLALSVYALGVIGLNPNYYLTTLPVDGVFSIAPEEIVNASGLAGKHIFAVNPTVAADAITDTPGILAAEVTLEWPNSVMIKIEEDTPIAIWEQADQSYWVNAEGDLIPARINVPGLLRVQTEAQGVIIGMAPTQVNETVEGEEAAEDAETIREETVAAAAVPSHTLGRVPNHILQGALLLRELKPEISTFSYHPSNGLSYIDGRGWRVYFGTGADMQQKLVVYENIVQTLTAENKTPLYISVSNQAKPYYMAMIIKSSN